jgi:hypothetical protein
LCDLSWYSGSLQSPHSKLYPNSLLSLLIESQPQLEDNAHRFIQSRLKKFIGEAVGTGAKDYASDRVKNTLSITLAEMWAFFFRGC